MNYENILGSQPFTFVVGPNKRSFIIHGDAFSRLSKQLDTLLNGPMKEAKEKMVHWEDVDEKTFVRFSQWAYTHTYEPAEPDVLAKTSPVMDTEMKTKALTPGETQPLSLASFHASDCSTCRACGTEMSRQGYQMCCWCNRRALCIRCGCSSSYKCSDCATTDSGFSKKAFAVKEFMNSTEFTSPQLAFTPRKNKASVEGYSEVFLCHTRLYVLADKYNIPELRRICLHKLYATLKEFTPYPDRSGDITSLVSYVFMNTLEGDKIRTLAVDYCTCVLEYISPSTGFKELINEVPDFAFELFGKVVKRLD